MAIFASTTLGTSDPSKALSIKALEARAQALAQASAQAPTPQSVPSPWQGIGNVANTAADALLARHADQAAAQRRQDLAGYIAKAGDNPTMADVGQITAADTDVGKSYLAEIQQRRAQAAQIQAQKELATQKAQQDQEYLRKQQEFAAGQPQSDIGKLTADVGRKPTEEEVEGEIRQKTMPSPSDPAVISKAQTENIDLQSSGQSLDKALELLATGKVYSDSGLAGLRTEHGQSVPKVLQGVAGVDPESTDISKRYSQLMKAQVLPILNKLKGSMSNADREWAIATIDNPSSTLGAKQDVIRMLKTHLDAELKQSNINLKNMGTGAVQVERPATTAPGQPATAADPLEGRTATGSDGKKIVRRNGKWEPM